MRQRQDFDAHVLEYAALKIPALPFQAKKCVFCKFVQHQPSPRCALASLRKATLRPAFDDDLRKAESTKYSDNYTVLLLITVREGRESVGVVGYHVGDDWNNAQNLRN